MVASSRAQTTHRNNNTLLAALDVISSRAQVIIRRSNRGLWGINCGCNLQMLISPPCAALRRAQTQYCSCGTYHTLPCRSTQQFPFRQVPQH